jgi:hypothetical protein
MSESSPTSELEKRLYHLYHTSQPDAEFVSRLKNKLIIEADQGISKCSKIRPSFFHRFLRPAWVLVLLLVVALASTLLIIGPQRVLAEFERLLGYLPGIGFVDMDSARVLAAPVQQQQGDVILQVDQLLASPNKTILSISTQGLDVNDLPYPNPAVDDYFEASILLPDGQRLPLLSWQLEVGNARLEFGPIPADVAQITLELPRLPLVPEGTAPQDWQVALTLRPASGDLPPDLFPPAYDPQVPPVTRNGITLQVLQVAQDAQETAMLARLSWEDPTWEYVTWYDPILKDNLGHVYWRASDPSNAGLVVISVPADQAATPSPQSSEQTFRMAPLSLAASQATFSLEQVDAQIPVDAGFHFDPGQDVQVGQTWDLGETIDAGGYKLRLVKARFVQNQSESDPSAYRLEFSIELPVMPDRKVDGLWLDIRSPGFDGSGGGMDSNSYIAYLTTDQVPNASIDVSITEVSVQFNGPWDVTWNLPQTNETSVGSMRTLKPEAPQTHNGVTLNVNKALLSDRLSVLYLSATGLPQDGQLASLYGLTPGGAYSKNRLFDQWNQEISFPQDVTWAPMGEPDYSPTRLLFAPLPLLSQSMRLEIPAVQVSLPADAALEFEIPPDLPLYPEEYPVQVIGGGGPERTVTQTHWVSDYWPMDISLQFDDFSLQFDQARLVQEPNSPVQLNILGRQISQRTDKSLITRVQFASLTMPDGQTITYPKPENDARIQYPIGLAGWDRSSGDKDVFALIFLVSDPDTNSVISGVYHAEINDITISVPGPWVFNMDLH